MQTILEILLVNEKNGTSKKTGNSFNIKEAHCILRNGDGTPGAVGVLTIPKKLEEVAKPGVYTAGFTLDAPTFGADAGKVVAVLASLVAVPPGAFKQRPAAPGV